MRDVLVIIIIFLLIKVGPVYIQYILSDYKKISGYSFIKTVFVVGNYGEFLIFKELEKLGKESKIFTNVYITKEDGMTTEVDLLLLSPKGIYVFESKNYSGWIFGDEKQKNWTQSLKGGKKNRFYNPIFQNQGHIKALKQYLDLNHDAYYKSYIVFSNRCTLKKVSVSSDRIRVLNRRDMLRSLALDMEKATHTLNEKDIQMYEEKLNKVVRVGHEVKEKHIEQVKNKIIQ